MACLCNLQVAQILNEIDTERLFSNIPEIYVANRQFWADHVYPMLRTARCAKAPLDPTSLKEGFLKVSSQLTPTFPNLCSRLNYRQFYEKNQLDFERNFKFLKHD